jgi:CubicO group peptidase (beta-lactamase class C family)
MAQGLADAHAVPGLSVAIVHRDELVHLAGYGLRHIDDAQARVGGDTVFQLASLSKPLAATVVAALVGDEKVSWDTRVADLDAGVRLHEEYPTAEVTIRDLFAHRSGLSGNAGNDLEGLGFSREEILRRVHQLKPARSFRSGFDYSNFGLTAGGEAAAKAAGYTWEDAADARLYSRLHMTSTSSRYSDFLAHDDRSSLHAPVAGEWKALTTRNPDPQSPAGGASSSARDLASRTMKRRSCQLRRPSRPDPTIRRHD